jgi:hypothetical protein
VPEKSKRKHLTRSKRKKMALRQDLPVTAAPPSVIVQDYKAISPEPTPQPAKQAPKIASPTVQRPYVVTELKRIAILAGIMMVVLVVLYFVIP